VDTTSRTHQTRAETLAALLDAGYTAVQDGRKKGKPVKSEIPNNAALASMFRSRFISLVQTRYVGVADVAKRSGQPTPTYIEPTDVQVAADLKQQISSLNHYLKTGEFSTNVGRDKAKNEALETARLIQIAENKAASAATGADTAKKTLLDLANREAITRAERDADELEAAEAEAEAELTAAKTAKTAKQNPTPLNTAAALKANTVVNEIQMIKDRASAEADALARQVREAALATVAANRARAAAEADVVRLKTLAEAKVSKTKKAAARDVEKTFQALITTWSEYDLKLLTEKLNGFFDS
jgi:hypothetical protein